jgi:hypothetical protein
MCLDISLTYIQTFASSKVVEGIQSASLCKWHLQLAIPKCSIGLVIIAMDAYNLSKLNYLISNRGSLAELECALLFTLALFEGTTVQILAGEKQ